VAETYDLILQGGEVFTPSGLLPCDVGVKGGLITDLGRLEVSRADQVFDASGLTVLPGVVDTQVHFREPGLEQKDDLEQGTFAAAKGGVTAVFEMPNTSPATTSIRALEVKLARARGRAWVDHAFYMGACEDNLSRLGELERMPGCCGVKIFMGSSTGSLLIPDDTALLEALRNGRRRVAVHCEDEARLQERKELVAGGADVTEHPVWRDEGVALAATERLLRAAQEARRPVHVLHVTTEEEVPLLAAHKDIATCEVTPQHLTLVAPECYERLGALAQMNPPIRTDRHFNALWEGVRLGIFDVIGSDHAPHTLEEKQSASYPDTPSGMPGVQTLLPLMLNHVSNGRLSLERLVDLVCSGPQRIFGIVGKGRVAVGYDADFTVVDLKAKREMTSDWLAYKCGWSPFEGKIVTGWPMSTIIRGNIVMREGQLLGRPIGKPLRFSEAL